MGPMTPQDIAAIALELARGTSRDWAERVKQADERVYGWKGIADELRRIRGVPVHVRSVRRWWKTRRLPIDEDSAGDVSSTKWELERWARPRRLDPSDE